MIRASDSWLTRAHGDDLQRAIDEPEGEEFSTGVAGKACERKPHLLERLKNKQHLDRQITAARIDDRKFLPQAAQAGAQLQEVANHQSDSQRPNRFEKAYPLRQMREECQEVSMY